MKVNGEVIEVSTAGDFVVVRAQCKHERAARWEAMHTIEFRVPCHLARGYFIGRKVKLTIETKAVR